MTIRETIAEYLRRRDECRELERHSRGDVSPDDPLGDADRILELIVEGIEWPNIHAFHDELSKGQDIREDAGGYFARALGALLGRKHKDPITTYRDAARALLKNAEESSRS